ncbi:MAG: hypothetical protein GX946_00485 [Oligosphaeraceae bacterium]|nr:hypothetical protein [Oligosphaeraceae bacterium]
MRYCTVLVIAVVLLLCSSCAYWWEVRAYEKAYGTNAPVPEMIAVRTEKPIFLDGKLDEEVWKNAPVYLFVRPQAPPKRKIDSKFSMEWKIFQRGAVRLAYTSDTLYLAISVEDSDIVQYNQKDQQRHFNSGDLLEIMVKSDLAPSFWECYGTPSGHRTTIRHIARGYCHDILADFRDEFQIGVHLDGTLNNYHDTDRGYTMEVAMPFAMLQSLNGIPVNNENQWKIFVARYNFDFNQSYRQLSCFPMMPVTKFEAYEYFAPIIFR